MQSPDVAVVGGGIIGLLTAAELVERGARVLVVEKDDPGFAQSGRNAGAINLPGGEANDRAPEMLRSSAREWDTFEERWECNIDLNRDGWNIVVSDRADEEWMEVDRATWATSAAFSESETLDATAARAAFPFLEGPFRALDKRHGGHVDPTLVMQGLQAVAERRGIEIQRGTVATGFDRAGDRVTAVRTTGGTIPCDRLVVAAGVWSSRLCKSLGFDLPVQRIRIPVVETGPVHPQLIPGFLRAGTFCARQSPAGTIRIGGGYRVSGVVHDLSFQDLRGLKTWARPLWQNRKDISLRLDPGELKDEIAATLAAALGRDARAFGAPGRNPRSTPALRERQRQSLIELIPALAGVRIHRAWAGIVDLTPDLEPAIGPIPGIANGYVGTGFSGHGFMYGPGAAQALAQLIMSNDAGVDIAAYDPSRLGGKLTMREQVF